MVCEIASRTLDLENAFSTMKVADQVNSEHLKDFVIGFIATNLGMYLDTPTWNEIVLKDTEMVNAILRKKTGKVTISNETKLET